MSTSLLYPYSSSQQTNSNSDKSSSIGRAPPCISLGAFNYTACQGPSKTPLLSARRYSPRPVRFHKFEQPVTSESALPFNEIESAINLGELILVNDSSPPTPQPIIPYEHHPRREKLSHSRRLSPHNNSIDARDISPISNNLFNFTNNLNQNLYFESNSSLSPISPVSPRTFSVSSSSIRFSPPSVHNCSQQKSRLKKSQSTLIMPSLLTLLRPESVGPPSTPIPKDLSSRSLNNFTIPSPEVRKCHTMVSLSPGSSNVATTKVMNERKPRFNFLRRISPSKSAVFTSKSSSSLQSSLSKSPSVTQPNQKLRKTSAEMWPHPEHPEEGNASNSSFDVDTFASIDKFIDGASEEERYFAGGCSRCASSTSVYSRRQSTVTNDLVFCKLCLSDVSIREMYQLQQCQCRFCTYCMCTYTSLKIREGETVIECPDFNCDCKGEITLDEIELLVGKELFELHMKFRRNKEIESDPMKTWCPRPGCDSVVCLSSSKLERKQIKGASCPNCNTLFCASCSNSWHPGKSCYRVAEHLGVPFNDIIKRCPRCKVPIERDAGCAQMQCKKCKHVFCWYCGISLEDDFLLRHYDKGPCKNKLGHSRASVLWHRAQVIIIFAGFGLLLVIASPLLLFVGPCLLCRSCRPCGGSGSSNSSIHDSDEGSAGIF